MDFIVAANLTKIAYIIMGGVLVFGSAVLLEHYLGLDHDKDINTLQDLARKGNGMPLAIVYLGAFILYASIVHTVLS